jgi:hypothetical protein
MLPNQSESSYAGQLLREQPRHINNYFETGAATALHTPSGASYLDVCLAGMGPALPSNARELNVMGRLQASESFRVENMVSPWSWRPGSNDWDWTLNQVSFRAKNNRFAIFLAVFIAVGSSHSPILGPDHGKLSGWTRSTAHAGRPRNRRQRPRPTCLPPAPPNEIEADGADPSPILPAPRHGRSLGAVLEASAGRIMVWQQRW